MAVEAYVLIESEPGRIKEIVDELSNMKEISFACGVTGPYDIIAFLKAPDMDTLGDLVMKEIQKIKGIKKTMSCLCTYCAR